LEASEVAVVVLGVEEGLEGNFPNDFAESSIDFGCVGPSSATGAVPSLLDASPTAGFAVKGGMFSVASNPPLAWDHLGRLHRVFGLAGMFCSLSLRPLSTTSALCYSHTLSRRDATIAKRCRQHGQNIL
jgi:hypothetical protein